MSEKRCRAKLAGPKKPPSGSTYCTSRMVCFGSVFIVPIARDPQGIVYQALFN